MPTLGLPPEGATTRSACAVPVDAPGLSLVFGRQSNDERKEEAGTFDCGTEWGVVGGESTLIFADVFVPTERVFMAGEGESQVRSWTGSLRGTVRTTAGARGETPTSPRRDRPAGRDPRDDQERHRAGQAHRDRPPRGDELRGGDRFLRAGKKAPRGELAGGPAPGEHGEAERDPLVYQLGGSRTTSREAPVHPPVRTRFPEQRGAACWRNIRRKAGLLDGGQAEAVRYIEGLTFGLQRWWRRCTGPAPQAQRDRDVRQADVRRR